MKVLKFIIAKLNKAHAVSSSQALAFKIMFIIACILEM